VAGLAWAANGKKMGVCTANRVYIFYNNMFVKIFFK